MTRVLADVIITLTVSLPDLCGACRRPYAAKPQRDRLEDQAAEGHLRCPPAHRSSC